MMIVSLEGSVTALPCDMFRVYNRLLVIRITIKLYVPHYTWVKNIVVKSVKPSKC